MSNRLSGRKSIRHTAMDIVVNGEPRTVPENSTILDLLGCLELEPTRVAVELNKEIVKAPKWGETYLNPDARVEIVQFVGGG